jgi:hypothetical protein
VEKPPETGKSDEEAKSVAIGGFFWVLVVLLLIFVIWGQFL